MLFKDLKVGQQFKFKFDEDSGFVYEKVDDMYFVEFSIPKCHGAPRHTKHSINGDFLKTCEVIKQ